MTGLNLGVIVKMSQKDTGGEKMNKRKLEAKMKMYGDIGRTLASYIGISRTTLSAKMNETNGAEFTQGEISKIKERYNLTAEEVDDIFFATKVS